MWRPEEQLQFDPHQFANRNPKAVSADYRGHDEWDTPGIAFGDLSGMHVAKRKVQQVRRLATPSWVMDDAKVRAVTLNFVEDRLFLGDRSGTEAERVKRINDKAQQMLPGLVATLEELQRRYHAEPTNRKSLAVQIQNFDSQIVLLRRGLLAVVVSVIYMYYRQGLRSEEVAEQLQIKPPMVRVWCFRLAEVERYLNDGTGPHYKQRQSKPPAPTFWLPERVQQLKALREGGKTWKQCAAFFDRAEMTVFTAWKKYLGALPPRPARPEKIRKQRRVRPEKIHKERRTVWTPERVAQLKALRESNKTFLECAEVMGFKRCQETQYAYARYVIGKK